MMIAIVLLLCAAPAALASPVADAAAKLEADQQQLADARDQVVETSETLDVAIEEHRTIWAEVRARLVAIYMHGAATGVMTRVAAGEPMNEVGARLDALDHVAEQDDRALRRWERLEKRIAELRETLVKERAAVDAAVDAVAKDRVALKRAQAAAIEARRAAERLARIRKSLIGPKILLPETEAAKAAYIDEPARPSGGGATAPEGARAPEPEPEPEPEPVQPTGYIQSGVASTYGESFRGQSTANGERFDPDAYTAAHPSLPFGTWVKVTGANGSVDVRINDRGPFVGGRVIDLSTAAAAAIGMPGIADVTITVS